jgi:threonine dehydrogenase-like Zn-dependent dehydrogenase
MEVLGVHRDGGLAEYIAVDARFAISAQGLSLDQAAMVEFLSIGFHAVERAGVGEKQKVLVAGAGPIGMAATLFARSRGAIGRALASTQTRSERTISSVWMNQCGIT